MVRNSQNTLNRPNSKNSNPVTKRKQHINFCLVFPTKFRGLSNIPTTGVCVCVCVCVKPPFHYVDLEKTDKETDKPERNNEQSEKWQAFLKIRISRNGDRDSSIPEDER